MHRQTLTGGCYCGNLQLTITLSKSPTDYQPRACDCDFCCKHGAAWLSDADGALAIQVNDAAQLRRYRQGAELAEFLLCAHCGVLVAVTYVVTQQDVADRRYAAINTRAVNGASFAPAVAASPKQLAPEEKTARWQRLWFADVALNGNTPD